MEEKDRKDLNDWIGGEQIREVATHEAGHAVLNVLTGAGIASVFIRPDDDHPELYVGQASSMFSYNLDEKQVAMVSAAGLIAESIRRGESLDECSLGLRDVMDGYLDGEIPDLCDEGALSRAEAEYGIPLDEVVAATREILVREWPAVEAIAALLLAKLQPGEWSVVTTVEVEEAMRTGRAPR